MKRLLLALAVSLLLPTLAQVAVAQDPGFQDARAARSADRSPVTKTPEMWFYEEQMRRYDDPWTMVRHKAEYRAQQRQRRIAAQKWYGFSKSRPKVNSTPWGSNYSPTWSSKGIGTAALLPGPYRGYR